MTTKERPDYKIRFGETEEEAKGDTYNNMTVTLNLSANESGARAGVSFEIQEGHPEGQFDMERKHISMGLSIEEAKRLISKLNCFVLRGEMFLEQYKEQ